MPTDHVEARVLDGLGDARDLRLRQRLRRRAAGGSLQSGARAAREAVEVAQDALYVQHPGDVVGLDARDVGVALVLCLREPTARIEAELHQRAVPASVAAQRRVGAPDLSGRLLVVDVLELDEGAVARGEQAGRDRLAAAVGADLQLDVGRRQHVVVRPEWATRLQAHRALE